MTVITNHMPTAELQALDAAHHMHPFTDGGELATKGARVITRAEALRKQYPAELIIHHHHQGFDLG